MSLAVGAVAAAAVFGFGFSLGDTNGDARVQKRYDEHLAADGKVLKDAQDKASAAEQKAITAADNAAKAYEKGKKDAEAAGERVVADLRAGNLGLRNRWAGCETGRLSEATASAAVVDATTRERQESAGRIVRAATECDEQVIGLQSLVNGFLESFKP